MTKKLFYISVLCVLTLCCGKQPVGPEKPDEPQKPDPPVVVDPDPTDRITDPNVLGIFWKDDFACETVAGVADADYARIFIDGNYILEGQRAERKSNSDLRYEFFKDDQVRYVCSSEGYALTLPADNGFKPDYTLAKYGMRFDYDEASLRVTYETVTPYSQDEYGYRIYTTEWLDRYFSKGRYLTANNLTYNEDPVVNDQTILEGYDVSIYSVYVRDAGALKTPYYKIAMVRKLGQWARFGLIVYKSAERENRRFLEIVKSWTTFKSYGTSRNWLPEQQSIPNPKWNAATKAYYEKLKNQKTLDFGVFTHSMPDDKDEIYESRFEALKAAKEWLESEQGIGHKYDIMPTYTPIGWYDLMIDFPKGFAEYFAGGDGFNGKPVLQFTYQFTINNNNVEITTPMFDILRGKYDAHFRKLARDIKAYANPVLFRLNNEMNSDWTSYCGMLTLVDPQIFIQTWRYLYGIFEEEGVDNCIWIWNPIATSCPYSNWGEYLSYWPGEEYVQAIGLTNYEMANYLPLQSFRERYNQLYSANKPYFLQYPWIISEFACGSGGQTTGEMKRNKAEQARWVKAMFDDFAKWDNYPYLQNIKGGIWFGTNDYAADGSVVNCLVLEEDQPETLQAFRDGFARLNN